MTTLYVWDSSDIELRDFSDKVVRNDHDYIGNQFSAMGLANLLTRHAAGNDLDVLTGAIVSSLVERLSHFDDKESALDYLARHGALVINSALERVANGHG